MEGMVVNYFILIQIDFLPSHILSKGEDVVVVCRAVNLTRPGTVGWVPSHGMGCQTISVLVGHHTGWSPGRVHSHLDCQASNTLDCAWVSHVWLQFVSNLITHCTCMLCACYAPTMHLFQPPLHGYNPSRPPSPAPNCQRV